MASSHRQDGGSQYLPGLYETGPSMPQPYVQPSPGRQSPSHNRTDSYTSGLKSGPRDPNTLASVQQSSFLGTEPRDRSTSRSLSPHTREPSPMSGARKHGLARPKSHIDLLTTPYPQAPPALFRQSSPAPGAPSQKSREQTLEDYRSTVKKSTDLAAQYSFAELLLDTTKQVANSGNSSLDVPELLAEAREIFLNLANKSYPHAQYMLADGYASGVFCDNGYSDDDKALPLFVAASKHGHAESGFRAGLCYEHGWGTKVDPLKATQFFRLAAAKSHPGAMTRLSRACLIGDLGGKIETREGVRWLKRAAENADEQHNTAPFELGQLHETGYGDDVFIDPLYAGQLYVIAADLKHAGACFRLGQIYEKGLLQCPRDSGLSIHYYHQAAKQNHAGAMLALGAWYFVGAPPRMPRDEGECLEWTKRAAETGLATAQFRLGYFYESGIGGRRDAGEASRWYAAAAEQGDEKAIRRIEVIRKAVAEKKGVK